jgi:predicted polyphosphate/ATP-dependent NAD kinase
VLGRGNQQLSPTVIRRVGPENILVLSTPAELARTPVLLFDTGDADLDAGMILRKFFAEIVGYPRTRMVKVAG